MTKSRKTTIVLFAQIPPPEHGQSRMVLLALETLRGEPESFEVHHVNARFSNSLEEIGESSLGKMLLTARYLLQAFTIRLRTSDPILYYVPGPVKWSSVLRDWVLLSFLRLIYPKVVFHWHAIGHGEWAHGSDRLALEAPRWVDRIARRISSCILEKPFASIAVSNTSRADSIQVSSRRELVINNGIQDPCPGYAETLAPLRLKRQQQFTVDGQTRFRILFLSHGTLEKGITDALDALIRLLEKCDPTWCFDVTFAGGVSESARPHFDMLVGTLHSGWPDRIRITEVGYLTGETKRVCFCEHDIFLAPSRWESFGLTVVEAMAYGLRIVAAASDGVKGVLPADHPYLGPVAAPGLLAENLMACCRDLKQGNRADDITKLRARFLELFQISFFSRKLVDTLIDLGNRLEPAADSLASLVPGVDGLRQQPGPIHIQVYLADQNPGYDRSFGISRMSQVVLEAIKSRDRVHVVAITSKTSQQAPGSVDATHVLPWGTRRKTVRLLTDHFHPLFTQGTRVPEIHYFPKGYLPLLGFYSRPSVVTIHDTIIQYDEDHYPHWRNSWEYAYWALMLKHTLRSADRILTVSESSKHQIQDFMDRHSIRRKDITVTYEPCLYEGIPQPAGTEKENYVIHLASCEPHKRTAHLVRWWHEAEKRNLKFPTLHLIGTVPPEVIPLLAQSKSIVKRPFLEDDALLAAYLRARALILPSEIEGFGLPALEAYYLGTPVCFVKGTSVEEVLGVATTKGGFTLDASESLFNALEEVMGMTAGEIRDCGLTLRETYAASKVAGKMIAVFEEVRGIG